MKEIISITELARLRGVTTETLRHYDRIGLLKPYKINENSNERFYSIYQYEKLGTIKELKQLGLSLRDIQNYFHNRNIDTTYKLLEKELKIVEKKINELVEIKKSVISKLYYLLEVSNISFEGDIELKEIKDDRYYLMSEERVKNEAELSYEVIKLEGFIKMTESYLPIFASNRYMGLIRLSDEEGKNYPQLGIQVFDGKELDIKLEKFKHAKYITLRYRGSFWEADESIQRLLEYARNNDIEIEGVILQTQLLDYTFIDNINDLIYEVQIKIKK